MMSRAPVSVIIPTFNAARGLVDCLNALVPGVVANLVREVIISDGGSEDETPAIADRFGASFVEGAKGRGQQLALGAKAASGEWLLFLHSDTDLSPDWVDEVIEFIEEDKVDAAVFSLAFKTADWRARTVAAGAMMRARLFSLPYGDQGLLIKREVYDAIGGYKEMALFEDVDMIDRLKRRDGAPPFKILKARAITSPTRYQGSYARRVIRNFRCLMMYKRGAPLEKIVEFYNQ